jgi:hypothetical protein
MKNFYLGVLLLIVLMGRVMVGCDDREYKNYSVTLEIHYPSKVDTITIVNKSKYYPELSSTRGSNIIYGFYETSAPIKILEIKELR